MSTVGGGVNIVTDGLVLYLDAANTKSYVSGSTIWNDVSRSQNIGTLVNGPSYNSTNGGSIVFDGSNDFVNLGNTDSTFFNQNSPWTIQFSVKVISFPNSFPGFLIKGNSLTTGVLIFYINSNTVIWKHNNTETYLTSIVLSNINTLTFTYQGSGNVTAYVNGVFKTTAGTISGTDTTSPLYLGRGDQFGNHNHYNFLKYNRALSASEVLQNYNATRTRYGL
jgi:hypothetical protein